MAFEHRAEGDVVLEKRATAVLDLHLSCRFFVRFAGAVNVTDGFDDIERPAAHRARVHTERPADSAGYAFEKFKAGQLRALGFGRNQLELRARAAMHAITVEFD